MFLCLSFDCLCTVIWVVWFFLFFIFGTLFTLWPLLCIWILLQIIFGLLVHKLIILSIKLPFWVKLIFIFCFIVKTLFFELSLRFFVFISIFFIFLLDSEFLHELSNFGFDFNSQRYYWMILNVRNLQFFYWNDRCEVWFQQFFVYCQQIVVLVKLKVLEQL